MKKLLITGFDPFGGSDSNPSELAVQQLPDVLGEFEIRKCIVPTVFGAATRIALEAAEAFGPDVILCIGVAAGRDAVTPERVAINLQDARIPDNAGRQPTDAPIVPGAPAAYFATIPLKKIVSAIEAQGLPARISNTAGTFVCNDLFYGLAHRYANTPVKVGFIHVPATDVLSVDGITASLTAAISACE